MSFSLSFVVALPPQRFDHCFGGDAIAERDYAQIERWLDPIDETPDCRHANLEKIERRGLESHRSGEDRCANLRFRVRHDPISSHAATGEPQRLRPPPRAALGPDPIQMSVGMSRWMPVASKSYSPFSSLFWVMRRSIFETSTRIGRSSSAGRLRSVKVNSPSCTSKMS